MLPYNIRHLYLFIYWSWSYQLRVHDLWPSPQCYVPYVSQRFNFFAYIFVLFKRCISFPCYYISLNNRFGQVLVLVVPLFPSFYRPQSCPNPGTYLVSVLYKKSDSLSLSYKKIIRNFIRRQNTREYSDTMQYILKMFYLKPYGTI